MEYKNKARYCKYNVNRGCHNIVNPFCTYSDEVVSKIKLPPNIYWYRHIVDEECCEKCECFEPVKLEDNK